MPGELLTALVRQRKGLIGTDSYCGRIPIRTREGAEIGTLVTVDVTLAHDPEVIRKLTRWRSHYMKFFRTQFMATEERTSWWLKNVVIPCDDRILFLVLDGTGRAIGNVGVCNLTEETAELDNFIRGEAGGHPNLIMLAEVTLLGWLFGMLGLQSVYLYVFSNNWLPINLHLSVGFTETHRLRLSRLERDGTVEYLSDSDSGEPVSFKYLRMELSKNKFDANYAWATAACDSKVSSLGGRMLQ